VLACELQQGHCIAHEVLHLSSFTAPNSLLSPSPSLLLHDVEGYNIDFSMELDPILPPPGLVDINTQPGRGLPTFSIDDELIQQGESQFFPIPPFLAVREYPDAYLCLGRITDLPLVVDRVEMRSCVALVVDQRSPS